MTDHAAAVGPTFKSSGGTIPIPGTEFSDNARMAGVGVWVSWIFRRIGQNILPKSDAWTTEEAIAIQADTGVSLNERMDSLTKIKDAKRRIDDS